LNDLGKGEMEASGMKPDVVSYNIVINICAKSGRPQEASDWPVGNAHIMCKENVS